LRLAAIENLLNFNQTSMAGFLSKLEEPAAKARTLIHWIHKCRVTDFNQMYDLNRSLREKLIVNAAIKLPQVIQEQWATDGVCKYLLKLADGQAIETVFIPPGTLCISSQVGCSLNCRFCATAQAGFNRNLTTAEIIAQLWLAMAKVPKITNVVLMGMGEPLLNYDAVIAALDLMLDDCAYGLSKYKVTVSTAGLVPAMQRLREDSPVSLAVSLHAPNNELRSQLVPLNKKYPLEILMPVCRDYFSEKSKQCVLFEYVMLAGVNDQLEHAKELVLLLKGIRCKVNLIPFNVFKGTSFSSSSTEVITEFQNYLINSGIPTWVRRTRGNKIEGACGQLAGQFTDRTGRREKIVENLT
jgi:23S rRNA (adenine2503-C2)-methyltransferase